MTKKKSSGSWWLIIVIIIIGFLIYKYFPRPEIWTAHYQRTTDNRVYSSQEFKTSQECADWMASQRKAEQLNPTGRYNFECGSNCKPSKTFDGMFVCDKTFDN